MVFRCLENFSVFREMGFEIIFSTIFSYGRLFIELNPYSHFNHPVGKFVSQTIQFIVE